MLLALALPAAALTCDGKSKLPTMALVVGGQAVTVEVADEPEERRCGLMLRSEMAPEHGMLFVYPTSEPRSFWMKDTLLPLSIAWMDPSGRVVGTADMTPLDRVSVHSPKPAMYALEMNQGWFARTGIVAGARIDGLPEPARQ